MSALWSAFVSTFGSIFALITLGTIGAFSLLLFDTNCTKGTSIKVGNSGNSENISILSIST